MMLLQHQDGNLERERLARNTYQMITSMRNRDSSNKDRAYQRNHMVQHVP